MRNKNIGIEPLELATYRSHDEWVFNYCDDFKASFSYIRTGSGPVLKCDCNQPNEQLS